MRLEKVNEDYLKRIEVCDSKIQEIIDVNDREFYVALSNNAKRDLKKFAYFCHINKSIKVIQPLCIGVTIGSTVLNVFNNNWVASIITGCCALACVALFNSTYKLAKEEKFLGSSLKKNKIAMENGLEYSIGKMEEMIDYIHAEQKIKQYQQEFEK